MNNIDKYIKLNLSLVKGDLIGLVCCSVFASLGIFLPSLAIVALVLLVVIIVLVIRIYVKLFEKTLFKEEAVLYQSLPVSTEEIIVAKTFVATVATTAAWIGLMGGTSIGLALLSSSAMEPILASVFLDLLNDVGAASAPIVIGLLCIQLIDSKRNDSLCRSNTLYNRQLQASLLCNICTKHCCRTNKRLICNIDNTLFREGEFAFLRLK